MRFLSDGWDLLFNQVLQDIKSHDTNDKIYQT